MKHMGSQGRLTHFYEKYLVETCSQGVCPPVPIGV